MMSRPVLALALTLVAGLLAGCTTQQSATGKWTAEPSAYSATAGAGGAHLATATAGMPGSAGAAASPDYRIGPLDTLQVTVFQLPDLTRPVQVSASGNITLPLIGEIQAKGKTATELQQEIASRLAASYLQSPQVTVTVTEYTSQRITVEGAVTKPGIYSLPGQATLLKAVASAQGLTREANPHAVVVFRNVNNQRMAARFDLAAIRDGKATDPGLQGGDTVVVAESGIRSALRDVLQSLPIAGLFLRYGI